MKKYLFLFAVASAFFLQSCDLEGGANYTPRIELGNYIINQHGDTLKIKTTTEPNTLLLDTIYIGDTLNFSVVFNAFANNVVAISLKQSADSLTRIQLPPVDSLNNVFGAESDYKKGIFMLKTKASFVHLPFKYIARAKGNEPKLTITVKSDAIFDNFSGSNTAEVIFKTPIKETRPQ
jgi:hypothetical protein